jgi:hypothetical protein
VEEHSFTFGLIVLIAFGLAGLFVFVECYDAAFPTASIDLKVSRKEAQEIAKTYVESIGFELEGYNNSIIFGSHGSAAVFLEKTQGMEKANELMRAEIPVWRWEARWFRPLQKEAFRVFVDPSGKVIRFHREIEEDAKGANIEQEEALGLAERFLTDVEKIDPGQYERVEASSEKRKNRTDHTFVWKKKGYEITWKEDEEAGVGTLRIGVDVWGDQIGSFNHFFKVPEKFQRDYDKAISTGQLLGVISFAFMVLIFFGAIAIVIVKFKAGDIRWKLALIFGITISVLWIAMHLNSIPMIKAAYPTQMGYGTFTGIQLVVAFIIALVYGLLILLTGAGGDSITREIYPKSISVVNRLLKGHILSRDFAFSSLRGYTLAFLFCGYITLFYMIGRKALGIWMPAQSPYSNMLGTVFPFIYPLTISLLAAVSEEFIFRFFAISILKKYLKVTFLALLIPAAIWAFAHSGYQVFPAYVRGIELTIAGLVFGYFFIKYGLMTVIIAHYVIDAIFIGIPLLRSENSYFLTSGIIVVILAALPAIPAFLGFGRRVATEREFAS